MPNDVLIMKEKDIIAQLKADSRKSLDNIYSLYAHRLYSFSLQYTRTREDAEEIVQDVFVKLWMARHHIRQEDSLSSLLFTIARRQLINAYRSRVNSLLYKDFVTLLENHKEEHACRLEYEEFVEQIKLQIDKLPYTQKQLVTLSRLEGYSNSEVARMLQLSDQTVRNQLSIAIKTLRVNLKKFLLIFTTAICHIL